MSNNFFATLSMSLGHQSEGKYSKFEELFNNCLVYHRKESLLQDTFLKFIYFDFLTSIGKIETIRRNGANHWFFIDNNFFFNWNKAKYLFSLSEEEASTVKFVTSSYDLFPRALKTELQENVTSFPNTLRDFELHYDSIIATNFSNFINLDWENFRVDKFNIQKKDWDSTTTLPENGIYRLSDKYNQKQYVIINNEKRIRTQHQDLVFIVSLNLLKLKETDLILINENKVTIPWKVKIPSLLKRLLAASSYQMQFREEGITYSYNNSEDIYFFIKQIKGAA